MKRVGIDTIIGLEKQICEGMLSSFPISEKSGKNIFGRSVHKYKGTDLSWLSGLASTGLRCSAFLEKAQLTVNYNQLTDLVRQHLPVVILYVERQQDEAGLPAVQWYRQLEAVSGVGCFQLVAADLQEAIDLTLIAHKVAERSLIPGIVALGRGVLREDGQKVAVPNADQLRSFLGDPDRLIPVPTRAQQTIFGEKRRLIPQWFSLETQMANGIKKNDRALDLETAAQGRFFANHLPEILSDVAEEYHALTGRQLLPLVSSSDKKAHYLVMAQGDSYRKVKPVLDQWNKANSKKITGLQITLREPFPEAAILQHLKNAKAITVLDYVQASGTQEAPLFQKVSGIVQQLDKTRPMLIQALHGKMLAKETLEAMLENMIQKKGSLERLILDIDFYRATSAFPQHEILQQSIRREYPDIAKGTISGPFRGADVSEQQVISLPFAIRRYKDGGPPFSRLSRLYHHAACFYQQGIPLEMVADPFQALPLLPPSTANIVDAAKDRTELPVFQPHYCTGCGACFTYCPHSAIPPIAIDLEQLIRSAMNIAAKQGHPVTELTPLVRNLAKAGGAILKTNPQAVKSFRDFLPGAFHTLIDQMKLQGERLEKLRTAMNTLLQYTGDFPVAITGPFFSKPESSESAQEQLFSVAVDPLTCTGCGLCAAVCEDDALLMRTDTPHLRKHLTTIHHLWEQFPNTPVETTNRLIRDASYSSWSALLLNRENYFSLSGSMLKKEVDAPVKVATHLITALAASIYNPLLARQISKTQKLINDMSAAIHQQLSNALPHQDFKLDLKEEEKGKADIQNIIQHLQSEEQAVSIDIGELDRKIALLDELKALQQLLQEGPTGHGMASYGVGVSGSGRLTGLTNFPYNSFSAPLILNWTGDSLQQLQGILTGLKRHYLDHVRLWRRAELEIKDKYRPEVHDIQIGNLKWTALSEEEQEGLPPLILFTDTHLPLINLMECLPVLVESVFPIKVVVLNQEPEQEAEGNVYWNNLIRWANLADSLQVVQRSLDVVKNDYNTFKRALKSRSPALLLLTDRNLEALKKEALDESIPEKVATRSEQYWKEKYEKEIEELRADYEERLKTQRTKLMQEVHQKLSNKLIALSKKRKQ